MNISLGRVIILVKDYDDALEFYKKNLSCKVIMDSTNEAGQRFVHTGFGDTTETGIWFLKADTDEELQRVGHQTGGQPMMVLYTDAFDNVYARLRENNVTIYREPVDTPEYKCLHFLDLYGNEIVLV